jgi:glycosyltransferase involved in cell wall biosynthesis
MTAHVLYVGGEDHNLRIPFLVAMRDRGFRVTAAGSGNAEPFERAGIPFRPFHFDRFISPFSDVRAIRNLAGLLRDLRPDLAQGYDTKPCLMLPMAAALTDTGTKTIRTICGRAWVYSAGSMSAVAARPVYRALHRAASWSTAATVFEIEDDREFFERHHMAGRNGIVIPAGGGGVDDEGFDRALAQSPSRDEIRKALGAANGPVVITVTRMTRQKGIPTLLKAAAMVHRERSDVRFLLVGPRESEGPLAVTVEEIEAHAPYVIATGPRSDVPALLRAADLFAFPTEYREGVPRVLLEAALARLPTVSTDIPGCCAVIRDGWNGRVVPTQAPEKLARGILDLLATPAESKMMADRTEEIARKVFSLRAIVARHSALYADLLAEGSPVRSRGPVSETPA